MSNATQDGWVDDPHKRKRRGRALTKAHIEARLVSARAKRDVEMQRVARRLTEYHWWQNNAPEQSSRPWFVFLFSDFDNAPAPGTPEFTEAVMNSSLVSRASQRVASLEAQLAQIEKGSP